MKRLVTTTLLLVSLTVFTFPANAGPMVTMPTVKQDMFYSDYWLSQVQQPNRIIMTEDAIATFNKNVIEKLPGTVYNLQTYPETLSKEKLTTLLQTYAVPTAPRYLNGVSVGNQYYQGLQKNTNISQVKSTNAVQYGFTVQRADIRTFPTMDVSLEAPNDTEFDQFQETAVEALQPLVVLHSSADKSWYFVQTANYRGWMQNEKIALTDKAQWLAYQNTGDFLVVTGPSLLLGNNPYSASLSELSLGMGVKIPLADPSEVPPLVDNQSISGNYVVKIPTRSPQGNAVFKLALISVAKDVHEGYLPYNRSNLLKQAFKLQGERYGWGGSFASHDCSSFVRDVYSSFGFQFARNADEQESAPGKTLVLDEKMMLAERTRLLSTLPPGSLLYMNGHTMMYLGNENGMSYIIHDIAAYGDPEQKLPNGKLKRTPINQVTVTPLELTRVTGKQLLSSIRLAKSFE